jgi:hypothetical protein
MLRGSVKYKYNARIVNLISDGIILICAGEACAISEDVGTRDGFNAASLNKMRFLH